MAKVKPGMRPEEVVEVLGAPSRQSSYPTGKAFTPFYYGPDRWLPPAPEARCWYVRAYARIKERWGLTVTPAQWAAIESVWEGCN